MCTLHRSAGGWGWAGWQARWQAGRQEADRLAGRWAGGRAGWQACCVQDVRSVGVKVALYIFHSYIYIFTYCGNVIGVAVTVGAAARASDTMCCCCVLVTV